MELYLGSRLTSPNDPLTPTPIAEVAHRISSDVELGSHTERLRLVLRQDAAAYKRMKTSLPYFCVSSFRQNARRITDFVAAEGLGLDIDWGATDVAKRTAVRLATYAEEHCVLGYVTPSGQGWRLVFAFAEPIVEASIYKAVYKHWASRMQEAFPELRGLDGVTHDVTRANFLAADAEVYYNPKAKPLSWREWLPNMGIGGRLINDRLAARQSNEGAGDTVPTGVDHVDTHGQTLREVPLTYGSVEPAKTKPTAAEAPYQDIRRRLRAKQTGKTYTQTGQSRVHVPVEVLEMIPSWLVALAEFNIEPLAEQRISYGMKLEVALQGKRGVVNIRYGKKGFSFTPEPKSGTDEDLARVTSEVLDNALYQIEEPTDELGTRQMRESFFGEPPAAAEQAEPEELVCNPPSFGGGLMPWAVSPASTQELNEPAPPAEAPRAAPELMPRRKSTSKPRIRPRGLPDEMPF